MSLRVLLVEDDRAIRESLVEALIDEGFDASTAIDGVDALAKLRAAKTLPQVLLVDLMMPRMSGGELAAELKKTPELAHLPIVVMSADAQAKAKSEAFGAAAWLKKPISLDALFEALHAVASNVPAAALRGQHAGV